MHNEKKIVSMENTWVMSSKIKPLISKMELTITIKGAIVIEAEDIFTEKTKKKWGTSEHWEDLIVMMLFIKWMKSISKKKVRKSYKNLKREILSSTSYAKAIQSLIFFYIVAFSLLALPEQCCYSFLYIFTCFSLHFS